MELFDGDVEVEVKVDVEVEVEVDVEVEADVDVEVEVDVELVVDGEEVVVFGLAPRKIHTGNYCRTREVKELTT